MRARSALVLLVWLTLGGCNAAPKNERALPCAGGLLSIDATGNLGLVKFPKNVSKGELTEREVFADLLLSDAWSSMNLKFKTDKHLWQVNAPITSSARVVAKNETVFVSSFEAPRSIFVSSDAAPEDRLPTADMVNVIVESSGRMFVQYPTPVKLVEASWCIK